jgi:DNA-directed RNA polymerase subunit RPC12/RpoP
MRKSCLRCSGPVELKSLDKVGVENKPLKVTVTGMPVASCRHGHKQPVDDDFMIWLIHELKDREAGLPAGNEQGMLMFKKYLCACGKELAAKSERRQGFPLELAYEGAPPFRVELEMPVYKCTGCGKEQLHSHKAVQGITSYAIAKFNDAAGFPHSG